MAYVSLVGSFDVSATGGSASAYRPLTERDAVDIWIARWLRVRRKDLIARYRCDPRRIYEIWEGLKFAKSREQAVERFTELHPGLVDRIDFGPHRRIPRAPHPDQLALFEELDVRPSA